MPLQQALKAGKRTLGSAASQPTSAILVACEAPTSELLSRMADAYGPPQPPSLATLLEHQRRSPSGVPPFGHPQDLRSDERFAAR